MARGLVLSGRGLRRVGSGPHHLIKSEGHQERTKHVDIYYHYIKYRVWEGYLALQHVRTHEMAADGLTKPLDKQAYLTWVKQIGLTKPTFSLVAHD